METEVHVYAFSIAANVLLSFFPFLIVMVSLCRHVLKWRAAEQSIYFALHEYFPDPLGSFIQHNLKWAVDSAGPFQVASVLLLLFTANGIFEPLEVALNRAWGIRANRSYLKNQLVSLGLIFGCGGLILLSTLMTAVNRQFLADIRMLDSAGLALATEFAFRFAAVPVSITVLFLVYWILPNAPVPPRAVVPVAVVVGILLEVLKYINLLTWPWLRVKLEREYGPFSYSVTILLWSTLGALVVLAGAEYVARRNRTGTLD